jgi:hypothetical protein
MSQDPERIADLVEIEQLCARYMAYASQFVPDKWLEVFTPDVEYSAFGTSYPIERMTELLAAAPSGPPSPPFDRLRIPADHRGSPRGQFIGNMPVVELDGDRATGIQHFVFIDQKTHAMRLAWYRDEYVRTPAGWRIRRRATTFLRKHGGFDSGRQHDPLADGERG